jgi:hypothetical protein
MITEEDIVQAREQEKLQAETYLKGMMDFVKWTSTVAIAAILWVGNTTTSITGSSRVGLVTASLAFLVGSLIIAVFTLRRVLTAWGMGWLVASEDHSFSVMKKLKAIDPSKVTEQKEAEQIDRLLNAIEATRRFSQPSGFNAWIGGHIGFLMFGLILYAIAQVLGTF